VRNLTNTSGVADRDPAWSPDGKWIAYFSDESGEYALHLRNQNGMGEVRKIDLGNPPSFSCGGALSAAPRDLFGEVYGDWLLEIAGSGERATGEPATATITFVDDGGTMATRVVSGPIVQGSLPTTYSGGGNGGACFHGYGSTG